jgi:hypothetical protein
VLLAVPLVPLSLAARQDPFAAGGVYLVLALAFAVAGRTLAYTIVEATVDL